MMAVEAHPVELVAAWKFRQQFFANLNGKEIIENDVGKWVGRGVGVAVLRRQPRIAIIREQIHALFLSGSVQPEMGVGK
jgi:hypothetical protein